MTKIETFIERLNKETKGQYHIIFLQKELDDNTGNEYEVFMLNRQAKKCLIEFALDMDDFCAYQIYVSENYQKCCETLSIITVILEDMEYSEIK